MVDDPYTFGQIAAANALSDVYAMGGRPITALNLACFPVDTVEKEVFNQILHGGLDKINESGAALLGGHSIDDKEIKYGLCVTGICHVNEIYSNKGAMPGDFLYLTKKLGTGFIVSALCESFLKADSLKEASLSMAKLNKKASKLAVSIKAPNALTDVTGFGLIGHLSEMMVASGTSCDIDLKSLPAIKGVFTLIEKGVNPSGTKRNRKYFSRFVSEAGFPDENHVWLSYGAETSGGLLMSVSSKNAKRLERLFGDSGEPLFRIGMVSGKKVRGKSLINLVS